MAGHCACYAGIVPRVFLGVTLAVMVLAAGPRSVPSPDAREQTAGRRLRVATYNLHFGTDQRERYNLQRTIDTLASFDADLIGVQEIVRNHPDFHCDDQPAQIAAGLRRATGRQWTYVYVNEWVTEERSCLQSGRGDDIETEGLAFFAPARSLDVDYIRLWHTRIGLRARLPGIPEVSVVVTHLASSAANQGDRFKQVETLAPWVERQGPLRIVMGDFNAEQRAPELQPLFAAHRDAWLDASRRGVARGPADGSTRPHKVSRIDYVTYTPAPQLQLESVEIVRTSGLWQPLEASDHRPVIATFRVRSSGTPEGKARTE